MADSGHIFTLFRTFSKAVLKHKILGFCMVVSSIASFFSSEKSKRLCGKANSVLRFTAFTNFYP